jgi:hypothetical protein
MDEKPFTQILLTNEGFIDEFIDFSDDEQFFEVQSATFEKNIKYTSEKSQLLDNSHEIFDSTINTNNNNYGDFAIVASERSSAHQNIINNNFFKKNKSNILPKNTIFNDKVFINELIDVFDYE